MRSLCTRHSSAWCSVNRPVSAIDRSASFPASRIRPLARSASTALRRSPSISASIIAVADLAVMGGNRAELDPGFSELKMIMSFPAQRPFSSCVADSDAQVPEVALVEPGRGRGPGR